MLSDAKHIDAASRDRSRVQYQYKNTNGKLHVLKKQNVDNILQAAKELPDHVSAAKLRASNMRLFATVPNVIALAWANESGTRIYSREWLDYVNRKLQSDEWKALRINY